MITIRREDPLSGDLAALMQRHSTMINAASPPEAVHLLDACGLALPGVAFHVMRENGEPVGMGAFKQVDATHAEIKSMHVLAELRGRGLARRMLDHLLDEAQAAGFSRISLETGPQAAFAAARRLYEGAGFVFCPAFEGYVEDPHSVFMTRSLTNRSAAHSVAHQA